MSRGPYPMLLMLAMSLPGTVRALGLGDIRVESALNEPLSAQIDIVGATREELAALTASVANREIFQRYGADRPSFLSTATFKVGLDGQGRPVLNIRSTDAFTDPLVSFLVDLRWGKNDIVREYSLLLDPPGYATPRQPEVQMAATPAAAPGTTPSIPSEPVIASSVPAATPDLKAHSTRPPAPTAGTADGRHRVVAGETLRSVTRQAGARSELHAQRMMIAIFRANPAAFDGNINRLHRDALLALPTQSDLDTISAADAKREVRAHMIAWRLDGRPGMAHHAVAALAQAPAPTAAPTLTAPAVVVVNSQPAPVTSQPAALTSQPVATAAPAAAAAGDDALKARVESLEKSLDDMHKELASGNARLQNLKEAVAQSEPAEAELVQMPIIATARAETLTPRTAAPVASAMSDKTSWFAPVLLSAGLLVSGFAYFRRRRVDAAPGRVDLIIPPSSPFSDHADVEAAAPRPIPAPTGKPNAGAPLEADFVAAMLDTPSTRTEVAPAPAPVRAVEPAADVPETLDKTTVSLEIDIEALERSYLDSLPIESTAETVAIDTSDLDTALLQADLNTAVIDRQHPGAVVSDTELDYNLVDLDSTATAQHVHMPSGLYDHPVVAERRTTIVDVLKMAIERDPNRRDLRMKLLETYYREAATNQRAFIEVVRKLSREKDSMTSEDWDKIMMMGKQIAADDILFTDLPKGADDDLAVCA